MDIQDLGSLGELVSGLAVLGTLIYLARQIKESNKQTLQQSLMHTVSSFNELADLISQSEEVASIVVRGRESFNNLNNIEKLRFRSVHARFLNNIEGWLRQVGQIYPKGALREQHLGNIGLMIKDYLDFPGVKEYLPNVLSFFPPELKELIEKHTV